MRYKLLQKKSIGKTKACSKHLRHIAIEKDIFSELNRCILQIFLKYIKLVIPKILFILVLSSFNFYLKIMWLLANKITITKQKFLTAPPLLAKTFMKSIPQHPLTHTRTHTHTHTHTHKHTLPQNFLLAFIDKLCKIQKIRILKKKKIVGDIIILHMRTKNHNHMRCSSWGTQWNKIFCDFGSFFALLPKCWNQNTKILKNKKSIWTCHHFKLVQQKTWSYDVCLLRYGMKQTNLCFFTPLLSRK